LDVRLTWEPPDALPPDGSPGVCNAYMQGLSPFQRLLWVVAFLARNDFVVVLANDLQRDGSLLLNRTAWAQVLGFLCLPCRAPRASMSSRRHLFSYCALVYYLTCSHDAAVPLSAQGWQHIMTAVAAEPASKARTVFDILNEPDSLGLRWEAHTSAAGAALPSVADAYHSVMAAGYSVNPGGRAVNPGGTCRQWVLCSPHHPIP